MIDRESIRTRPAGRPLMHQTWDKLLFLHWSLPVERMRPLIPSGLDIDTWDGRAWLSITPFTMRNIRPEMMPAAPVISRTHELNVRTYVHHEGVPGIWFFSLDANNLPAVLGARLGFALPYFLAKMDLRQSGEEVNFTSRRVHPGAGAARFEARWNLGEAMPPAEPETRDFFLIERYCLYAGRGPGLYRARIFHPPWMLRRAEVTRLETTMAEAAGLTELEGEPLVHAQAAPLDVEVWPLERVGELRS